MSQRCVVTRLGAGSLEVLNQLSESGRERCESVGVLTVLCAEAAREEQL